MLFHVNFYFLFSFVLLVIMCALCIVFNKTFFRLEQAGKKLLRRTVIGNGERLDTECKILR